jgi:hypothetical protein
MWFEVTGEVLFDGAPFVAERQRITVSPEDLRGSDV